MTKTRTVTLVYFHGDLLGHLLEEEDYTVLGGQSLANAFDNHHVQLALAPSGQFRIVDDIGSDAYCFVTDVVIDELPVGRGNPWLLGNNQNAEVCDALADASAA